MSYSCLSQASNLTEREEFGLTALILNAIETRPKDWSFSEYVATDAQTGIQIWISNGPNYVRVWRPLQTGEFRRGVTEYRRTFFGLIKRKRFVTNGQRILDALHIVRHQTDSETFSQLKALFPKEAEEREFPAVINGLKAQLPENSAA